MILRNVAIRHGRKAFCAPIQKSFLRSLTTESSPSDTKILQRPIENHMNETGGITPEISDVNSSNHPPSSSQPSQIIDKVQANHIYKQHIKKRTNKLGSIVQKHYDPESLVQNPPKPEDITLELLMASQSHLGHSTSLWNPANQRYIYGIRQGVHIISLEETAAHLRRAAKVVEGVAYHGGLILFVGTRAGQSSCVVKAAQLAKGCHLFERWIPGSITNGDQILSKCDIKVVDKDDNEITTGYEAKIEEWSALKPDLVVCLNPLENYIMLHECGLNNIPTIGIIDTDADPTWVTYPIPANDDSMRSVQVIAGVLGQAGAEGQRKRLLAAMTGTVTWTPPPGLGAPQIDTEAAAIAAQPKFAEPQPGQEQIPATNDVRGQNGVEDEL